MAGDAVIGALRIFLGIDTGQLEDGLKKSTDSLSKFARDAAAVGVGVELGKAIEKVVEGFGHLIKSSIETADNMGKLSQKIGIPVESLSSLQVAAKLSDVGVEQLGKAIGRLDKEMVAAAAGGTSDAAAALRYLGITTKDLQGLNAEKTFGKIAESISKMEDGANKTAVVMAIFGGRMGKEIIPLLNMGSRGFEEMARTAAALGLVISTQTAKQSEKFMDNLKLMGLAIQGVGLTVAKYFVPEMAKSSDAMVKWIVDGNLVTKTAEGIIRFLILMKDNLIPLGIVFGLVFGAQIVSAIARTGLAILGLAQALIAASVATVVLAARLVVIVGGVLLVGAAVLAATGQLDDFMKWMEKATGSLNAKEIGKAFIDALGAAGVNVRALTMSLKGVQGAANDANESLSKPFRFDPQAAANAKAFSDELLKIQLKTRELRGEFDGLAPGLLQAGIHLKLIKDTGVGFIGTVDTLTPKLLLLNTELMKFAGAKVTQENLTGWQQFEQQMIKLDLLLKSGEISWETWARAAQKAAEQAGVSMSKLSDDLIGGWRDLFQALGQQNEKFFRMGQALAIVMAIINTAEGVTKALAQGGFWGIAMAAAVAAKGAAQIVTISSQKFKGAAEGGTFMVPGGSMGVDTKMVSMALAPGELVEVTPAARAGATENGYLELSPIRPKDFFTGDVVREMVFSIDQWMRDGGTGVRFANR